MLIMADTFNYSGTLAAALILFCVFGNSATETPNFLHAFPYASAFIPFPVVLTVYLRRKARQRGATSFGQGVRLAERVVRMASIGFATFFATYSYFFFDGALDMTAAGFFMTLIFAWGLGMVCALICAWGASAYGATPDHAGTAR